MPVADSAVGKRRRNMTAASAAAKAADKAHKAAAIAILTAHPSRLCSAISTRRRASCDSRHADGERTSLVTLRLAGSLHRRRQEEENIPPDPTDGVRSTVYVPIGGRLGPITSAISTSIPPPAAIDDRGPPAPDSGRSPGGRAIGESSMPRSGSLTSEEGGAEECDLGGASIDARPLPSGPALPRRASVNPSEVPRTMEAKGKDVPEPLTPGKLASVIGRRVSGSAPELDEPGGNGAGPNGNSGGLMVIGAPEAAAHAPGSGDPSVQGVHVPAAKAAAVHQGQPSQLGSGGRTGALTAALLAVCETRRRLKAHPPGPPGPPASPSPLVAPGPGAISPLTSPAGASPTSPVAMRLPPVGNPRSRNSSLMEPPLSHCDAIADIQYGNSVAPDNCSPTFALPKPQWPSVGSTGAATGGPTLWRSCHALSKGPGDGDPASGAGLAGDSTAAAFLATRHSTGSTALVPASPGRVRDPPSDVWPDLTRNAPSMAEWVTQRWRSSVHLQPLKAGAGTDGGPRLSVTSGASYASLDARSTGLRALLADRGEAASWYTRPVRL